MQLQGTHLVDKEEIHAKKRKWLFCVYFPYTLEKIYLNLYRNEASYEYRFRAPMILFLYIFLNTGIFSILPKEQTSIWFTYHCWVGVLIIITWLMSFSKYLNRFFDVYICLGSMASTAISFYLITILETEQHSLLYHVAMVYTIIIIYGFIGLRFYTSAIAGWCGGIIGIIINIFAERSIDWTFLNQTYIFSSLLGMALAYANDRQHRKNFIQNCIIELNQRDLTTQAKLLSNLSRHDALTGLANRRYLDEVIQIEWNRSLRHHYPFTIMMVDIDYFKLYNDALGHINGDKCLQKIAKTLSAFTSRGGELAARYGGEEFLLLFPATDSNEALNLAQHIMDAIQSCSIPHPSSDISSYVTISIGIATAIPTHYNQICDIMNDADQALYQAKINGRNQICTYSQEQNTILFGQHTFNDIS